MTAHDDQGTQPDLVGYGLCSSCHTPVRDEVLRVTRGLCEEEFIAQRGERKVIEVRRRGAAFSVALEPDAPKTEKNRRRDARRKNDEAWKYRKARSVKARQRADRRLRQMFPEIHAVLVAEERARDGLNPFPTPTTVGRAAPDDFAAVYDQLTSEGISI